MSYNLADLKERLSHLPRGLLLHCERTSQLCGELALSHGADLEKAFLAGLLHDVARSLGEAELLALARRYNLPRDRVMERIPVLLHGPVGAEMLRRDFSIEDEGVLGAVACHSTGRPRMTRLDHILYVADKIEPGKIGASPDQEELRRLVERDLQGTTLLLLTRQLSSLLEAGFLIHPATVKARNALLMQSGLDDVSELDR